MATNDRKLLQYGVGLVYNTTSGLCLGEFSADWKIIPELTVDEVPLADAFEDVPIPKSRKFRVQATLQEMTPQWMSDFFGVSLATGGKFFVKEKITASTVTITLTYGSGGTQAFVGVVKAKHIAGDTYRTEGTAAAGVSFSRSGKVLTLHVSDAGVGADWEVAYYYTDSSTTDGKLIIDPTVIPGQIGLLLPFAMINPKTGAIDKYVVWDCTKCVFTKLPEFGGGVQDRHQFQFEVRVVNQSAGDLVFYANGYNPTH